MRDLNVISKNTWHTERFWVQVRKPDKLKEVFLDIQEKDRQTKNSKSSEQHSLAGLLEDS